jgi:uracil-DNA glycosylase family 4
MTVPTYWGRLTADTETPIYPLDKYGVEPLHELYGWTATALGEPVAEVVRRVLYERNACLLVEGKNKTKHEVKTIPGHVWGTCDDVLFARSRDVTAPVTGPRPADVMVIGKTPEEMDHVANRLFTDATGKIMTSVLSELRATGFHEWYMTNLVPFMPPSGESTLKSGWLKAAKHLLDQQLRLVRPAYILCLGSDAGKALLGKDCGVNSMTGRVVDYEYEVAKGKFRTAKAMVMLHPRNASRDNKERRKLVKGLGNFIKLVDDSYTLAVSEADIDHRFVETIDDLKRELLWLEENLGDEGFVAIDAEWHGDHPQNVARDARSGLLSVQLSVKEKTALCIELRNDDGTPLMKWADGSDAPEEPLIGSLEAIQEAYRLVKDFFHRNAKTRKKRPVVLRPVGHFFVADLEWLVAEGCDLREEFAVSYHPCEEGVDPWESTKRLGGVDTGLLAHAIEETGRYGLDELLLQYTSCPSYWLPLQECLKSSDGEEIQGFGDVPRKVRAPYAAYDADGQFRLLKKLWPLADRDHEGNSCRKAFWESMIAAPAVLEMHETGVLIDQDRAKYLTNLFIAARQAQLALLRSPEYTNWPDFNPRSTPHVKEHLFGKEFNGAVDEQGNPRKLRPGKGQGTDREHGGKSLRLTPVLNTSKPPKRWVDIPEEKWHEHSASTNKTSLSLLAMDNEAYADQILAVKNFRFLDQVPKTVLRPPARLEVKVDKKGNEKTKKVAVEVKEDSDWEEEGLVYDGGLLGNMCWDGRVRTHFYQTKETGRWSSSRPNLQALSKTRDKDLSKIFKTLEMDYRYKLRSILRASPGHCMIEADFTGAELYGAAIMAGDDRMIEDCLRNQLKETDPDYLDIHSMVANMAFNLGLSPTKKALEDAGKEHLRTIAKTVVFGIMYGRSAKAVALASKEQGVKGATTEDAQKVIDTIFGLYNGLPKFFDACKEAVLSPGWIRNTWGRLRRFPVASDEKMLSDFQRQAMNFPIQSLVAGAMNRALAELLDFRKTEGPEDLFRMQLQIHDAVVLEVPHKHVAFVANEVLPYCMSKRVKIYQSDLQGRRLSNRAHRMGASVDVFTHWSEHLDKKLAAKLELALAA